MDAAPDLRLYHSNSLEILAHLLAEQLQTPLPGQALLQPEVVLIPQAAIRRWLQAVLAARHGIAANLEFLTPGEFVARALAANVPGEGEDLGADSLRWRVYAALRDPGVLRVPALQSIVAYLAATSELPDPLKPWALAGELAATFEKYQAWRRDWLLQWENGIDADHPQAVLWQHIAAGRWHRARRIQAYLDGFEGAGGPMPTGLPRRLFAFAILSVSPDVLRVIATQARVGSLHLYIPSPARSNWGDLETRAQQRQRLHDVADGVSGDAFAHAPGEHRLLQAWGQAGRDFMQLLETHDSLQAQTRIVDAHADPFTDTRPALDAGGLSDSLLHRVQGDVFHRHALPSGRLRDGVRLDDPSVHIHACHTRLRELQVLHDQLRALLDDPRFDPPLEPREIAVLAPEIEAYAPYLASVFGVPGDAGRLPWTLADANMLASEPLVAGFLRLLGLPLSRFGVHEVFDLMVGTPLAASAGLDVDEIERLRQWLHAAGARWGLDAEHRCEHAAPQEAAYTWQFALSRLLLGHASGEDAIIAADGALVAAWPELEGSQLETLNRLLVVLGQLDNVRQMLHTPTTPEDWQQRLLRVLDVLAPSEAMPVDQARIQSRLRQHITAFARSAHSAGFAQDVPLEVVRAYFNDALSQRDTRAPLLTGGISFGRMVPMRLLPFRVICVLGMNDGEFPHRDPAAGLNRMLSELHHGQRRAGDRSTRDDDRFLFLQLMLAAQEVFYLSYLGADPRDGSAREPSVLVSEWLDALAAYHVNPAAARKALVVHHPLQPFSAAAFGGDGELRRFSYHAQWSPAASSAPANRAPLPPWYTPPLPAPLAVHVEDALPLDALRRFLSDPAGQFLRQRMGLRLEEALHQAQDIEPLVVPQRSHGLEHHALRQHILQALLDGQEDDAALYQHLLARALLPTPPLGWAQFQQMLAQIRPCAQAFRRWDDGQARITCPCAVDIDGQHLHGQVRDVHPSGLVRLNPGPPGAGWIIRSGLDWLLANAAGRALPLWRFVDDGTGDYGPQPLPALPEPQARAALQALLQLRARGLAAPLLFAPYTGWEVWQASADKREQAARNTWHGGTHSWGEGQTPALQLALRGLDPFADEVALRQLVDNSLVVFSALCEGVVHEVAA